MSWGIWQCCDPAGGQCVSLGLYGELGQVQQERRGGSGGRACLGLMFVQDHSKGCGLAGKW